jgi:hypothetical protein
MKLRNLFLSLLIAAPVFAADAPPARETPKEAAKPEFIALEAAKAGPDFAVQGEYEGTLVRDGKPEKYGAQVAALGNGNFHAVFLVGGLPGAGWDGKTILQIDGKTEGDKTTFVGKDFSATIQGDSLAGAKPPGETFSLKKVLRHSPTEGIKAPAGASTLFDGTDTAAWERGTIDERKLINVNAAGTGAGPITRRNVQNFFLHLEFVEPFKPGARGQARGNSGLYIQQRYEVQILDSFGFKLDDKHAVGDLCGEIYKQKVPDVSMNYPPLSWQTYDIDFQGAQFGPDGKKIKNAVITVKHNGVAVHDKYEIIAKTGAGQPEGAEPKPLLLQNHGNPVFFRNIWMVEK